MKSRIQPNIKSQYKISKLLLLVIGGIGFLILGLYLATFAFESEFVQIMPLILSSFFGIIGLYCFKVLVTLETLVLDSEKLAVKSFLSYTKKFIYLKDILRYTEIKKENNSEEWYVLTVFTHNEKHKITSSLLSNYDEFKRVLIKNKIRDVIAEKRWTSKFFMYFGFIFLVLGLLLFFGSFHMYLQRKKIINKQELTTLEVTVSKIPEIIKSKYNIETSVSIETDDFPAFVFIIRGDNFKVTKAHLLIDVVKPGDVLEVDILTDDFNKKLQKSKSLSFREKSINYNFINMYGLRDENLTYLDLDNINKESSNPIYIVIWMFIWLGISGFGVFFLYLNQKENKEKAEAVPQRTS